MTFLQVEIRYYYDHLLQSERPAVWCFKSKVVGPKNPFCYFSSRTFDGLHWLSFLYVLLHVISHAIRVVIYIPFCHFWSIFVSQGSLWWPLYYSVTLRDCSDNVFEEKWGLSFPSQAQITSTTMSLSITCGFINTWSVKAQKRF